MLRILGALASQIVAPVAAAAQSVARVDRGRRSRVSEGCAYLEVRGVHEPGSEDAAEQIIRRLEKVPGVAWAEIRFGVQNHKVRVRIARTQSWYGYHGIKR